jgi:uncharacterized protein YuzE
VGEQVTTHRELEPLPGVVVVYTPETRTLSIQAGPSVRVKDGEEVAKDLTAFYDSEGSLVAIDLESAELLLKPFLDAVLSREKEELREALKQSRKKARINARKNHGASFPVRAQKGHKTGLVTSRRHAIPRTHRSGSPGKPPRTRAAYSTPPEVQSPFRRPRPATPDGKPALPSA